MMREIANQAHRLIPRGQDEAGVLFRVTRSEHGLTPGKNSCPSLKNTIRSRTGGRLLRAILTDGSRCVPSSFSSVQKLTHSRPDESARWEIPVHLRPPRMPPMWSGWGCEHTMASTDPGAIPAARRLV